MFFWSAKYLKEGPILAAITPEDKAEHGIGPGGGDGGIGVGGVAHFVIYGGLCPQSPKDTLDKVQASLNYRAQPRITLYSPKSKTE